MSDEQIINYIQNCYFRFLEREPLSDEVNHYLSLIKEKKINQQNIIDIFITSPEYIQLQKRKALQSGLSINQEKIISQQNKFNSKTKIDEHKDEPEIIFISCFNESSKVGGVFYLSDNQLNPIIEKISCRGIFYENKRQILFIVIREIPQIIAFKWLDKKFERLDVEFSNYHFAEDVHDLYILNDYLYVVATNGEKNGEKAIDSTTYDKDHVGKIIVSKIDYSNKILIKNSQIYNPLECSHHHHINDLANDGNNFYLSAHSHCDSSKNNINKGAILILDKKFHAKPIFDIFEQPHSLYYFKNRLYVCSSSVALLLSLDLKNKTTKIEYKGPDVYIRGLLVTPHYFYLGISDSTGRTNARFTNSEYGVLKIHRNTGITEKIHFPSKYNNIYKITSNSY